MEDLIQNLKYKLGTALDLLGNTRSELKQTETNRERKALEEAIYILECKKLNLENEILVIELNSMKKTFIEFENQAESQAGPSNQPEPA